MVTKWAGSIEIGVTTHAPSDLEFPSTMTNVSDLYMDGDEDWVKYYQDNMIRFIMTRILGLASSRY